MGHRTEPDGDTPVIHVDGMGTIRGGQVATGGPTDVLGTFVSGRPATEKNLTAVRRWFLEVPAGDYERLNGREMVDRASGLVYEVLVSDPLLSDSPGELGVASFLVEGDVIRFLRSTGTSIEERERAVEEQVEQAARAVAERERRLAKVKQIAIPLSVVYGERMAMGLREAAQRILDAGGRIERGEPEGCLRITVPENLTGDMLSEWTARAEVGVAAEVLTSCSSVVLAAIIDLETDGSKRPRSLLERLPNKEPVFGGGVA
jgi:hypothetical protein